jgi:hypothetical protein
MPNQALEQTRDSVLRYGESVGCELLNFFVRQQEAQSQSREAPSPVRVKQMVAAARSKSRSRQPTLECGLPDRRSATSYSTLWFHNRRNNPCPVSSVS